MPWDIRERGGKFCVIKRADGTNEGCHGTRAEAKRHMAALYANEGDSMGQTFHGEGMVVSAEQIGEDGTQWIEVMPVREKAKNGQWYFTVTEADLEVFAESIRRNADKIAIDRDHSTDEGGTSRAAGWYTGQAEVRQTDKGPRLVAQVRWTKSGLEDLRNREFRFISPVFSFEEKDAKSGLWTRAKEIVRSTLTNNPFFTELAPVAHKGDSAYYIEEEIAEALIAKLGEDAARVIAAAAVSKHKIEQERARSLIEQVRDGLARESAPDKGGSDAVPDQGDPDVNAAVIAELGLPEDADDEAILAKVAELKTAAPAANEDKQEETAVAEKVTDYMKALGLDDTVDPNGRIAAAINAKDEQILALETERTELKSQIEEAGKLTERIADLEKRDRARDIEVLLAKAVEDFRVLPAEKEKLAELFLDNVAGLRSLVATRPKGLYNGGKPIGSSGDKSRFVDDPEVHEYAEAMRASDPVDTESVKLHLAAEEILKEQGKGTGYTADEYFAAYSKAQTLVN